MKKTPIYPQSAVIPYRVEDGRVDVLLVTSVRNRHWVVPKGLIEPGLDSVSSAAKEAEEEAGIRGTIDPNPLGTYEYKKWGGTCQVEVFAMYVEEMMEDWPEAEFRTREWFGVEQASEKADKKGLRKLIALLPVRVLGAGKTDLTP